MNRPDGWDKILLEEIKKIPDPELLKGNLDMAFLFFAEAGADAMLEGLRKRGMRVYEGNLYGTKFGRESLMSYAEKDGTLVFIPEEKK